jgi:polyphosphate kinase
MKIKQRIAKNRSTDNRCNGDLVAGERCTAVVEGRDAAGKDGGIKRMIKHLSPRETHVVAQLPSAQELVFFHRSWYNCAGVEPVMGFSTENEYGEFMLSIPKFEERPVNSGIKPLNYFLNIGKNEQINRLANRVEDPLKECKQSPIDVAAVKHWKAYSEARDTMLLRTHSELAPWSVVRTEDKQLVLPDPEICFQFLNQCVANNGLAT